MVFVEPPLKEPFIDAVAQGEAVRRAIDRSHERWVNGDVDGALAFCREALSLDPHSAPALCNLGTLMWIAGDVDEAERCYRRAHEAAPAQPGVMLNLSALRNDAGDLDGARMWIDRADRVQPGNAETVWRRSLVELALGDYANGWKHYEAGLNRQGLRGVGPAFGTPPWDGSRCDCLLLWHEQGFGDTMQFVRYAERCRERARKVFVLCPAELVALIERCPFVDGAYASIGADAFDRHASIMSLPALFETTIDTVPAPIPYLFADPARVKQWSRRLRSETLNVGLVWAGQFRSDQLRFNVIDRARSMSLDDMLPLLRIDNVTFYSLQKGDAAQPPRPPIVDVMHDVRDFAETAAIIANLDLVISVDTAVAHLAGAMGKPVWVLSRRDACWRWLQNRRDSPWYPSARVFGQATRFDWRDVVDDVSRELSSLADARQRRA